MFRPNRFCNNSFNLNGKIYVSNRPTSSNIFVSFSRGAQINIREYDSLNSNLRKEQITKQLDRISNPNQNDIMELEEIVIELIIPKLKTHTQKKLYLLHSLEQDLFKFIARFTSIQKTHEWCDKTAIQYLEFCIQSDLYDTLEIKPTTKEMIDQILKKKYDKSTYNNYKAYLKKLKLEDFQYVDDYCFVIE